MPDMSILQSLIDSLSAVGQGMDEQDDLDQAVLKNRGPGGFLASRAQEMGDAVQEGLQPGADFAAMFGQQLMQTPQSLTDLTDAYSTKYLGSPLILGRDEAGNPAGRENMFTPVGTGISEAELLKSGAKLSEEKANALAAASELQRTKQQGLQAKLDMLRSISMAKPEDVYVAKGDKVLGGSGQPSSGTFSKSGKGFKTKEELTRENAVADKQAELDFSQKAQAEQPIQDKARETILEVIKSDKSNSVAARKQAMYAALAALNLPDEFIKRVLNSKAVLGGE